MKIRDVTTHFVNTGPSRNWVLVKVSTDEGVYGWGEASVEGKEKTVAQAIAELERQLVGRDPFQIELLWQEMYRNAFWVGGPILNSAISGVEQALWDIKGKELGVPVWQLLGGRVHDRVRAYANGWFRGCKTPKQFARAAVATGERLFTKWGFKDVIEKQAAAVIQPDICHDGGILETRKIAAMAEVYYVGLAPHNPNGPPSTAACVHVDACTPNFLIQEFVVSDAELRKAIQKEGMTLVDGHFVVPDRPGLGVDIDEGALARFPYQPTTMTGMLTSERDFHWD